LSAALVMVLFLRGSREQVLSHLCKKIVLSIDERNCT
jgi:hypothetical protein